MATVKVVGGDLESAEYAASVVAKFGIVILVKLGKPTLQFKVAQIEQLTAEKVKKLGGSQHHSPTQQVLGHQYVRWIGRRRRPCLLF